jgi:hypothetical protein
LCKTGSENAHGCEQNTEWLPSALTLLERYHKDGNKFLNNIIQVTGGETSVSFVNVETKEQSKQ